MSEGLFWADAPARLPVWAQYCAASRGIAVMVG